MCCRFDVNGWQGMPHNHSNITTFAWSSTKRMLSSLKSHKSNDKLENCGINFQLNQTMWRHALCSQTCTMHPQFSSDSADKRIICSYTLRQQQRTSHNGNLCWPEVYLNLGQFDGIRVRSDSLCSKSKKNRFHSLGNNGARQSRYFQLKICIYSSSMEFYALKKTQRGIRGQRWCFLVVEFSSFLINAKNSDFRLVNWPLKMDVAFCCERQMLSENPKIPHSEFFISSFVTRFLCVICEYRATNANSNFCFRCWLFRDGTCFAEV